jgi:hypothetical protein
MNIVVLTKAACAILFRHSSIKSSEVIPVTEVNLARVPSAPKGEVRGGSSLEGVGKGRLWRKGSCKGVDRGAQRVNALLSHLSCLQNLSVNLIAVNQMDPYDSDSSDGGSEFSSQSTNPRTPSFQRSQL